MISVLFNKDFCKTEISYGLWLESRYRVKRWFLYLLMVAASTTGRLIKMLKE